MADLSLLRAETHKFESHYIDNLVGKISDVNDKLVCFYLVTFYQERILVSGSEKEYFERSPINYVDKFSCPIILFQGLDDKVRKHLLS